MGIGPPSSTFFCRMCWLTKQELKEDPQMIGTIRTKQNYDEKLATDVLKKQHNLIDNCILNELDYHITENFTFDLLHDYLEGTTQLLLNQVLKACFREKVITEEELNRRINSFEYGAMYATKKPSFIDKKKILQPENKKVGQHGYQALLLMQTLPFIIYDKFDKFKSKQRAENIQLVITMHLQILSIIMSPVVPKKDAEYLDMLCYNFANEFVAVFGKEVVINKFHHCLHSSKCILECGPSFFYNTARYEQKHQMFKKRAGVSHNFINPTFTLAKYSSYEFLYKLAYCKNESNIIMNTRRTKVYQDHIKNHKKKFESLNGINDDNIFMSITYLNETYKYNMFICFEQKDNYPYATFGKILLITKEKGQICFFIEKFKTIEFSTLYYGYEIQAYSDPKFHKVKLDELKVKKALCYWVPYDTNLKFIPRTSLEF